MLTIVPILQPRVAGKGNHEGFCFISNRKTSIVKIYYIKQLSIIAAVDHHKLKMTLLKFPSKHNNFPLFNDIFEDGYHIFNLENAKIPDYYPHKFPDYPGVNLKDLNAGDVITIKVFFRVGSGENIRADDEYLDLEVEFIADDTVCGVVLTTLPKGLPLETGSSIEVFQDEILYKSETTEN